ncbi:protein FAR1-RELATED SEQUENCE 5-like [Daucus carota subsp. sativus]|uniref:protein FAR1-RELATED SEQUENCE 5-like n=1 Tax=Daucus carota subsp. sativus TaxID=79200 RepID=UPI003083DA9C
MSSSLFSYVFSGKSSSDSENEGENNFDTFVPIDIDKIVPRRKKSNIKASDVVVDLDDLNDEFVNYHEEETKKYDGGGGDGCYRGGSCSTPQKRENSVNDFGSTSKKKGKEKIFENLNDFCDGGSEGEEIFEDVCPRVGQIFNTLDEAERFYRDYGRRMGFEVIIRSTHRHSRSDAISSRLYICRKGRKSNSQSLDFEDEEEKVRRVRDILGRTDCEARMYVVHRMKLDVWEITLVDLVHNHAMITPDKVQFMQRSRNIGPVAKSLIETLSKSGIGPSQSMNILSEISGGLGQVGFTNQDISNLLRSIRHKVFDSGDAETGLALLRELSASSFGNFFYRVELDDENRVNSLLWVDSRSLNAYKNFGDVVTFDSTYRTNKYCMPFIPITGVNHHYQSILFGFALIRDEKETSYKWVLKTWLEAVNNIPPISIITDQDIALGNAIAEVLPDTNHTYCTWHISRKFTEKLSSMFTKYPDFKKDFKSCLYKSVTGEEFEHKWMIMITKYKLENHSWLNEMYSIKHKWIGVYTRFHFAAGMSTTGRSESMNSFFDEYVKPSTGLKEFIENSQKALEKQYLREVEADYETQYKQRRLILGSSLECHAANIYTKEMFRRFQHEFRQAGSYVVELLNGDIGMPGRMYVAYKSSAPEESRSF